MKLLSKVSLLLTVLFLGAVSSNAQSIDTATFTIPVTAVLSVASVTPFNAPIGAQVTINGTGFIVGGTVTFTLSTNSSDTITVVPVFIDAQTLNVLLPPTTPEGTDNVMVTNPNGASATCVQCLDPPEWLKEQIRDRKAAWDAAHAPPPTPEEIAQWERQRAARKRNAPK